MHANPKRPQVGKLYFLQCAVVQYLTAKKQFTLIYQKYVNE